MNSRVISVSFCFEVENYDQEIENEEDYGKCIEPRGDRGIGTGNIVCGFHWF